VTFLCGTWGDIFMLQRHPTVGDLDGSDFDFQTSPL